MESVRKKTKNQKLIEAIKIMTDSLDLLRKRLNQLQEKGMLPNDRRLFDLRLKAMLAEDWGKQVLAEEGNSDDE
jgi:hypothetical protein